MLTATLIAPVKTSVGVSAEFGKKFLPSIMPIPEIMRIIVTINPKIDKNLVQGRVPRRASLIRLSMALSVSRFVLLSVPETVCTPDDTI